MQNLGWGVIPFQLQWGGGGSKGFALNFVPHHAMSLVWFDFDCCPINWSGADHQRCQNLYYFLTRSNLDLAKKQVWMITSSSTNIIQCCCVMFGLLRFYVKTVDKKYGKQPKFGRNKNIFSSEIIIRVSYCKFLRFLAGWRVVDWFHEKVR